MSDTDVNFIHNSECDDNSSINETMPAGSTVPDIMNYEKIHQEDSENRVSERIRKQIKKELKSQEKLDQSLTETLKTTSEWIKHVQKMIGKMYDITSQNDTFVASDEINLIQKESLHLRNEILKLLEKSPVEHNILPACYGENLMDCIFSQNLQNFPENLHKEIMQMSIAELASRSFSFPQENSQLYDKKYSFSNPVQSVSEQRLTQKKRNYTRAGELTYHNNKIAAQSKVLYMNVVRSSAEMLNEHAFQQGRYSLTFVQ